MSIDLNLYLLKDSVSDIESVIPEEKCGGDGFHPVRIREDIDISATELACWVKKKDAKPTSWCAWLEAAFEFHDDIRPETQSSGCIVLIRTSKRVFAACFGTGRFAIPDELIGPDFGLTVALNEVNPKRLRTLVTKSIDIRTRQRDTHQIVGGEVPEFDLDLDVEWLRAAEGSTAREDCTVVAGSNSLRLGRWNRPFEDLPRACAEFLATFERGTPETFRFVDSIRLVPRSDPLHQKLEEDLQAALQLRYFEVLSIGLDAHLVRAAREYFVTYGSQEYPIAGLDDDALREGLDALASAEPKFDHTKVYLKLVDLEGDEVMKRRLDHLIQMEIDRDKDQYIRVEQRWFRCRAEYLERVNERVKSLPDFTSVLGLPVWDSAASHPREEDYNSAVASDNGWLLQDQKFWYHTGEKVEPCDLLTPERHFIHVKKGASSSDLSHLFAQASGSADLLHRHPPFANVMKGRYEAHWPGRVYEDAGQVRVVLAIARPPGAELFGKMLLSRINLLEHARRVQSRGFEFGIVRVDYIE